MDNTTPPHLVCTFCLTHAEVPVIEALLKIEDTDIQQLAMRRASDYHDTHGRFFIEKTTEGETLHPVKALARAFDWKETVEGLDFWLRATSIITETPDTTEALTDRLLDFFKSDIVYESTDEEEPDEPTTTGVPSDTLVALPHFGKDWWYEFQRQTFADLVAFTRKKNDDYTGGEGEVDNPFANFDESASLGIEPLTGLTVRILDKIQRLKAYTSTGGLSFTAKGDAVEDIFKDLIGYSTIALGMLERSKHRG